MREEADELPEWQRAIAVGVRFTSRNGGEVVLSSIDLWSDRIALHFAFEVTTHPLVGPDGRTRIGPGWSVGDDLGTPYEMIGGGAGGQKDLHFGNAYLVPAVPEAARWLYIASPELLDPIEVPLK